jgi:hypothetical protein
VLDVHEHSVRAALGDEDFFAGDRHAADLAGGVAVDRGGERGVVAYGDD